jgi:FMN-dependent dehydrogenase
MANKWFETVAVAQRRAKRHLPKPVYGALIAGAEEGVTIRDNVAAFAELGFAPHVAGLPATREMATTVMGQPISLPVVISPKLPQTPELFCRQAQPRPRGYRLVQRCGAESVQVWRVSCTPFPSGGTERQSPDTGLTNSPLDARVQACAAVPLHGYQST